MDLITALHADIEGRVKRALALRERMGTLTDDQLRLLVSELRPPELRTLEKAARRNGGAAARMPHAGLIFRRIDDWDDGFTARVWTVARDVAAAAGNELAAESRFAGAFEALNAYWVALILPEAFAPRDQAALKAPFLRIVGDF